ncbi:Fc.00g111370.m01.CDS01 [Cosmosporella sp. VM-42]
MSSMFKKKGGLAFKPKIPSARPRPATPAAPPKPSEPQPPTDSPSQAPTQEVHDPSVPELSSNATAEANTHGSQESFSQKTRAQPPPESSSAPARQGDTATGDTADKQSSTASTSEKTHDANTSGQEIPVDSSATNVETNTPVESTASQSAPVINKSEQVASSVTHENTLPVHAHYRQGINLGLPTPGSTAPEEATATEVSAISSNDWAESSQPTPTIETPQASSARPKPRTRRQSAKTTQDKADGDEDTARPKKRQSRTALEGDATVPKKPRKRKESTQNGAETPARRRRARSVTPEDAETQVVDLQKLKMSDLTKDLHIGRKFSRHDELRERERKSRLRSKSGEPAEGEREDTGTPTPDGSQPPPKKDTPPATASGPTAAAGPQFRIVDGQIVVDQSSLVMDRHARDAAAQGDMETIEENDFTRLITSNSFMNTSKLKGPNIWNDEETELFYRGLRMFGTDFEMISKMFPGKQRRHVKLKYNREERHCPGRIDAAVMGVKTIKLDIEEYKAFTGHEFESVESIEAEQRKAQEDFEAEQKRIVDEQAEIERKKREELFADEDDGGKKKKKKGKKQTIVYGLNGEPITTGED